MLFAAYPSPSGYAPPPKRSANPLLIVLGVCGGCALVAVVATVIGFVFLKNKAGAFLGRTIVAAQFAAMLQGHQYDRAETFLAPQEQQTWPVDALRKKLSALEAKNGSLTGIGQVQNTQLQHGTDPNQIKDIVYNLNFQNGSVVPLTIGFDNTPGQESKIARLEFGGSGSGGGDNSDEGTAEKPHKKKGAHKGSAGSGTGE
jgi:hypothetical protein